jgi:hypothetical protein
VNCSIAPSWEEALRRAADELGVGADLDQRDARDVDGHTVGGLRRRLHLDLAGAQRDHLGALRERVDEGAAAGDHRDARRLAAGVLLALADHDERLVGLGDLVPGAHHDQQENEEDDGGDDGDADDHQCSSGGENLHVTNPLPVYCRCPSTVSNDAAGCRGFGGSRDNPSVCRTRPTLVA